MKMVKSVLLGSAAGVVAVAGAQAADLPVKAKPVEYVKVCSLYGAGYYYIPGTDICAKLGGYVRYEANWGNGNANTAGQFATSNTGNSFLNSRTEGTADYINRLRAYITMETRQQTQYGTLRTYLNVGVSVEIPGIGSLGTSAGGFNANRAFIQIAGFTLGRAVSFYDYYSAPAVAYHVIPSSDAGDGGVGVMAYTAQFGNGLSGTIALEEPRGRGTNFITPAATPTLGTIPGAAANNKKQMMPDIVANLRVDQAWGGAQIMGAIHDASPGYWTAASGVQPSHPSDKFGWAVGAGLKINTPFVSPGDYFQAQVNYAVGASKYANFSAGNTLFPRNGGTIGYGLFSDGVYTQGTEVELTTMWSASASYEHFWTPSLRTSVYGGYAKTTYNAVANATLCAASTAGLAIANCNNNWAYWAVGSRSQWNVTKDFSLGVDVAYFKLETANAGGTATWVGLGTVPTGAYTLTDQSFTTIRLRAHRDIVP